MLVGRLIRQFEAIEVGNLNSRVVFLFFTCIESLITEHSEHSELGLLMKRYVTSDFHSSQPKSTFLFEQPSFAEFRSPA